MNRAPDTAMLISEAQAAFEQIRQDLGSTDGVLQHHVHMARQLKQQVQQVQQEQQPRKHNGDLALQAIEQVRRAQYTQGLPGKPLDTDPLTRFARQVRRSRQLI